MTKVLLIKPLGPAKLTQMPVLPSNLFSPLIEPALGVSLPSTVLGIVGSLFGVSLSREAVLRDPLLGIGALVEELENLLNPVKDSLSLVVGPLVRIAMPGAGNVVAVPVYSRTGTLFIRADTESSCIETAIRRLRIDDRCVVGRVATLTSVGIHLADLSGGPRVVRPGFTFRRLFTCVVGRDGTAIDYEFVYFIDLQKEVQTPARAVVRLGGEQRYALVRLEDLDGVEGSNELKRLLEGAITNLIHETGRAKVMLLTPAPLIPRGEPLYYDEAEGLVPEFIGSVVGIPSTEPGGVRKEVVRLGLGFSEVAEVRRPKLPALPPGTVVETRSSTSIGSIAAALSMAGYYQALRPRPSRR